MPIPGIPAHQIVALPRQLIDGGNLRAGIGLGQLQSDNRSRESRKPGPGGWVLQHQNCFLRG